MASNCLLDAGDNYHQCDAQVENYKTCKRFWVNLDFLCSILKIELFSNY